MQNDLENLSDSISPTVTSILSLQGKRPLIICLLTRITISTGGFARLLVNISAVKSKVDSGVTNPSQIYADSSSESVVNAWASLKGKGLNLHCSSHLMSKTYY